MCNLKVLWWCKLQHLFLSWLYCNGCNRQWSHYNPSKKLFVYLFVDMLYFLVILDWSNHDQNGPITAKHLRGMYGWNVFHCVQSASSWTYQFWSPWSFPKERCVKCVHYDCLYMNKSDDFATVYQSTNSFHSFSSGCAYVMKLGVQII